YSANPDNVEALDYLVESAARFYPNSVQAKKYAEEIRSLIARVRSLDPHNSFFYRAEALLALHQNDLERAKQLVLSAIETDPRSVSNALLLGEISYSIGDYTSAKQALEEATKGDPGQVRARYFLAKMASD